jgi:class 3 adenylate cyclase
MSYAEQRYTWTWNLTASPEALWPLVSNTDRFNRDCGHPPIIAVPRTAARDDNVVTNARRLRTVVLGVPIEWDELAFEWVAPRRFSVERRYYRGPLAKMVVTCELSPRAEGGTAVAYTVSVTPSGVLGRLAIPFSIGRRAGSTTERVFRRYDEFALNGQRISALARRPQLAPGGPERLTATARTLIDDQHQPAAIVQKLAALLREGDDLSVARIRPYAMADEWHGDRRDTLHVFLHATRAGLLDFSWDIVCPHCRGAKKGPTSLNAVNRRGHCDSCQIDFDADFDRSVELTFSPNPSIRAVTRADYCVGGPQVTPHIVAQQSIEAGSECALRLNVVPGRYRLRGAAPLRPVLFRVQEKGPAHVVLDLSPEGDGETLVGSGAEITIKNSSDQRQLAVLEHLAWTDQATTAAEVTSLQLFRDLFSQEVLRPGEQISVGAMTIVFTDLKNSTQLYRQIGDAPAFGRVLTHFEMLKAAVAEEDGCIVKTMGDAIMAAFPRPLAAVRAMIRAHKWLANPTSHALPEGITVPPSSLQPLMLKAGLHVGSCLAINQNERLDYFGTTVNTAARLCGHCTGEDLVLSAAVCADPEVSTFLSSQPHLRTQLEQVRLKGLGDEPVAVRRLTIS